MSEPCRVASLCISNEYRSYSPLGGTASLSSFPFVRTTLFLLTDLRFELCSDLKS